MSRLLFRNVQQFADVETRLEQNRRSAAPDDTNIILLSSFGRSQQFRNTTSSRRAAERSLQSCRCSSPFVTAALNKRRWNLRRLSLDLKLWLGFFETGIIYHRLTWKSLLCNFMNNHQMKQTCWLCSDVITSVIYWGKPHTAFMFQSELSWRTLTESSASLWKMTVSWKAEPKGLWPGSDCW